MGEGTSYTDAFMSAQLPPAAIPVGKWPLAGMGCRSCSDTKAGKLFIMVATTLPGVISSGWMLLKLIRINLSEVASDLVCYPWETLGEASLKTSAETMVCPKAAGWKLQTRDGQILFDIYSVF